MRVARLIVCAAALGIGCGDPTVVRVVDGRPEEGRFISQAAYAYYAHAVEAEAAGDLDGARRWIEVATTLDADGPEAWTKLAALRCRVAPMDKPAPVEAIAAFDRAAEADPAFAPQHRERARCALAHGDVAGALASIERAMALDPGDPTTSILRAQVLDRAGKQGEALQALEALAVERPRSAEVWLALLDVARRANKGSIAREAAARASALSPEVAAKLARAGLTSPLAALDAAIAARDLEGAQRLAHKAKIPFAEIAVRAVALGRAPLAKAQAELVLGADPASSSARIALAAAADLAGDEAAIAAAMRGVPARTDVPSELARLLFAEVLARRASREAALAWLGRGWAEARSPEVDPLLTSAAARLRERLGAPPSK